MQPGTLNDTGVIGGRRLGPHGNCRWQYRGAAHCRKCTGGRCQQAHDDANDDHLGCDFKRQVRKSIVILIDRGELLPEKKSARGPDRNAGQDGDRCQSQIVQANSRIAVSKRLEQADCGALQCD